MPSLNQKIYLVPSVEIIKNEDGEYFILDEERSRHFRINQDTASMLQLLSKEPMTGNELLMQLQQVYSNSKENIEMMLQSFLQQLYNQEIIEYDITSTKTKRPKDVKRKAKNPMLKFSWKTELPFVKVKKNPTFLGTTKKGLALLFLSIFVIAIALISYTFITSFDANLYDNQSLFYLVPIIFIHLILHELSHIVMCKKMGGNIKEVGIGFLYYFIPVAFVTYKDTYSLSRLSRAKMAIIGPIFDLSAMSLVATFALLFPSFAHIFIPLLFFQLSFLIFNLNILLPSDLYRFIESLSTTYNVRRRAFQYVWTVLTKKEKQLHQMNFSRKTKSFYFLYTLMSVSYVVVLFIFMMTMFRHFFRGELII